MRIIVKRGLPYKEGDWFGIPVEGGGYAVGLIARCGRKGKVLFGYFFGPRREVLPPLTELRNLKPDDAILIGLFGDLDLYKKRWPVIGSFSEWKREKWPMPLFVRTDSISGEKYLIRYSEDEPTLELEKRRTSEKEAEGFPKDGLAGAAYISIILNRLLGNQQM